MSSIFISYRRDDSATVTGRIYDRLIDAFGYPAIFKDVDNIPLAVNFADHVAKIIESCAVQVVVIGPHWVDATDQQGQRRLDDPKDVVRLEVEAALKRGIPVVPLFVDDARVPAAEALPTSLQPLVGKNGAFIRGSDFDRDMRKVNALIAEWVKPLPGALGVGKGSPIRTGLAFGTVLGLINIPAAALGALAAGSSKADSTFSSFGYDLLATAILFLPALLLVFLAARSAARTTGIIRAGVLAGTITAVLGSVVGGLVFGAVLGTPAVTQQASSAANADQILLGLGLWVMLALVVGPGMGALGGLAGRRAQRRAAQRLAGAP